jgi:tetratricopeptide (TPR) repeat protein
MLDIEEFNRKKQKLFEKKDQINTQKDLQEYFSDLELVCLNESSSSLVELFPQLINKATKIGNDKLLFSFYWLYFRQIYYFAQTAKQAEKLMKQMREISEKTNDIEQEAIVITSESLYNQYRGKNEKSVMLMSKALDLLDSNKELYPETYHNLLFAHTLSSFQQQHYTEAINNMEKCLSYFYQSNNTLAMIKTIAHLMRFYTFLGLNDKYKELINWIFFDKKIQEKILDSHSIMLFTNAGKYSTIRNEIDKAIEYLSEAYERIKNKEIQLDTMYDYTDTLRILSRCYAYQGHFEQAYNLLVELINFVESDFVKRNSLEKLVKIVYFSTYHSLLFIFVQLDMDVSHLKNDKLKHVYNYINSLLTKTKISEDFLLDASLDEKELKELLKDEKSQSKYEVYHSLHQLLLTQVPHTTDDKTAETISLIKDFTYTPLFAEILLGKIHLAKGNYNEFSKIVDKLKTTEDSAKIPILKIWIEFLILVEKYLEDPTDDTIIAKIIDLEEVCRKKNFMKMSEEIKLYHRLITSSKTIKNFKEKFKLASFMDVFSDQSKEMVMQYLENKD